MLLSGQASTWGLWSEPGAPPRHAWHSHTTALTRVQLAVPCPGPCKSEASNPTPTPVACHLHWTRAQDSCPPGALVLRSSQATATRSSQWKDAPLGFVFSAFSPFLQIL